MDQRRKLFVFMLIVTLIIQTDSNAIFFPSSCRPFSDTQRLSHINLKHFPFILVSKFSLKIIHFKIGIYLQPLHQDKGLTKLNV